MPRLFDFDLNLTDGLLLGALVPVCIYLTCRVYRSGSGGWGPARWLLVMRSLAFSLVLVLMMEPILAMTVKMQRKPLVAVIVDDSESMRVEEEGRARRDIALEVLKGDALRDLRGGARVAVYRFSDALRPVSRAGIDSLRFDGRATDIAGALDDLREMSSGEGLIAAILLSDGGHNLGGRPQRAAMDLGAPLFAVGIGNREPPKDLALTSGTVDPLGYVGRDISMSVGLKASGFDGAQELVKVEEEGRTVAVQPAVLSEGEQAFAFSVRAERPGRHVYRVSVAPQAGERSGENNALLLSTEVLENRVRVLLVGGGASPDLAYLRRTLEADPNLELELEVAARPGKWPYRMQALLARPEDRDLVILFDLPAEVLAGEPERKLEAFVRGGGGLLVVGGARALNRGYALSPLSGVLPLALARQPDTYREDAFSIEIPRAATRHPILRISEDPLADRSAWAELPPLLAYNRNDGARPGAIVLIRHPAERAGGAKMPLVAAARVGAGKTMVVGVRTFWRFGLMMWGIGKADGASRSFWANAVRWLITREDIARVRAATDRPTYRSGEPIAFHAQVFDELLQPYGGARVAVSIPDSGGVRTAVLKDDGEGRYSGQMGGFPQGDYAFRVDAMDGDLDLGEGAGRFTVGRYSLEYEAVRMDAELLQDLAARSGGAFVAPEALPAAIRGLNLARQPVTAHYRSRFRGRTWPLFLLVCLLGVEWAVRRRRGMI